MKLAIVCVALLAVAARSGCGDGGEPAFDPCAGKACGASCSLCRPGDGACATLATACDGAGQCVAWQPGMCGGDAAACTGKFCGESCTIVAACRAATPPCMVPDVEGTCSADGHCLPLGLPVPACPPVADCPGKTCGDACNPCYPAACGSPVATVCDRGGRCVAPTPSLCYDPCAGKGCGAECHACPPDAPECVETAVVKACDASGRCVARTPGLACP